jgi:hypothetical protein
MDRETVRAEELFAQLERLGEAEVQRLFDAGSYQPREEPFVREWLLRRAEDRARRQAEDDQA